MTVFAISDLHLPGGQDKPMHVFGEQWRDHPEKIQANWLRLVAEGDLVLVGGDLTWAMRLAEAEPDLRSLGELPGTKVLIKGNHDYWWTTDAKLKAVLPPSVHALNGHAARFGDVLVAGTRGWSLPGSPGVTEQDEKIYQREVGRLRRALEQLDTLGEGHRVAMLHYPPVSMQSPDTELARLLREFHVPICIYGHLHGAVDHESAIKGDHQGVRYHLTSCDYIDFAPSRIPLGES
jgi:predicted phosphohydrolase